MADPEASARIFISYRREDSSGHVLALLPSLRKHFGDRIFKDTDNIPPGEDFVKFIKHELQSCSVLLAIIGKDWLTVRDPRLRTRRLDNPDDFLRVAVDCAGNRSDSCDPGEPRSAVDPGSGGPREGVGVTRRSTAATRCRGVLVFPALRRSGRGAVVILIFAIWSWIYFPGSRSIPPAQSSQPASAPSPPSTTAATEPVPATPPPVSSVPVEKPAAAAPPGAATNDDPSQQRVAQLRQDARDQFQRGQRVALNTVMTGLTIAPEDAELRSILDSMLTDAHRITGRSKAAATSAGAAKYTRTYHEALKLEQDAARQITAGRKDAAIRILWRAEETFDRAERDATLQLAEIRRQEELAKQQRLAHANAGPPNASTVKSNSGAPAPAPPKSPASKAPAQIQPRAPEPVPTGPGSQPSASDLERARVAGIVHRYAAGYSALNAAAVSAVYPAEAVWQFSEFDFYTLKVDDLATELSPDGSSATVVCTATHTFKRRRAPAPVTERLRQTFSLRKRGAGWIIASIGYDRRS